MAAFEKVPSGLEGLDRVLDWIRLGDNVVWQVSGVDEYRALAMPFARRALADGRRLIYIRFAPHEPILEPEPGLVIHHLDPSAGFERFTGEVHRIIAEAGYDAFYVFDSLSELQTAWAADLMMGNFFMVTCPYLFELDTVAWFCVIRHRHSFDAIARIRETTQLLIDLYPDRDCMYIHPLKVWKRYSATMFFPHRLCLDGSGSIQSLTDGVAVSRFYQLVAQETGSGGEQNLDSWERFFLEARELLGSPAAQQADAIPGVRTAMAERLLGTDERLLDLAGRTCDAEDMLAIKDRMIGSGKIGGKSAGMILSRRIVGRCLPELAAHIEPHDSWFIGSDVFYTYLVQNKLWKLRIVQRTPEGYFTRAEELRDGIRSGEFPDAVREQFLRMLEYFGQNPIIVRSSSLLEDSFGHAFAGKYESIFCVNTGSPEDRMAALEDAVRRVYASTMDESALTYRLERNLSEQDEQMAILVQRVSGSLFGDFFMPAAAGVGYSRNNWRWHRDLEPADGMLRLVLGLGTRAVDRTGSDYPRLVSPGHPEIESGSSTDRARYCQRSVDGLNLSSRQFETRPLEALIPELPEWLVNLVAERDTETERLLAERGQNRTIWLGTCAGLVRQRPLLQDLRAVMQRLEAEYGTPVDIEFTINWTSSGDYLFNLLQCRPLQVPPVGGSGTQARINDETVNTIKPEDILLYAARDTMGPQLENALDAVILINPIRYWQLPYKEKPAVARIVGRLNRHYKEARKTVMLLSPGRIGTTSPELGLPVTFAEISGLRIVCEVACSEAGYQPELSYGSHFFQDLVEAGIFYVAVSENKEQARLNTALVAKSKNLITELVPDYEFDEGLVQVYEPQGLTFCSDSREGSCLCARLG